MKPVEVRARVPAAPEEVFDYLGDLANLAAYADHYMRDLRLTRPRSHGIGAAARFRLEAPLSSEWTELVIDESERPSRMVERGRFGRLGRSTGSWVYELAPLDGGATQVSLTVSREPATRARVLRDALLGARRWHRRQAKVTLRRLARVLDGRAEHPERALARATVAGYEPLKAARFGG